MLPVDDPLLRVLVDPRPAEPTIGDALYVRLVDLARALAGRTYAVPVDVVIGVGDPFAPWNTGRWRLSGGPEGATCAPTTEAPDLTSTRASWEPSTSAAPRCAPSPTPDSSRSTGQVPSTRRRAPSSRRGRPWCPFVF